MKSRFSKLFCILLVSLTIMVPRIAFAQALEEKPTAAAMAGDLLIARPVLLALTAASAITYVVALPFTLAGGNTEEATETLITGPVQATFVRCLGCTRLGRKEKVVEFEEQK